MPSTVIAPLYSEGLKPEEWDRRDIFDLVFKGERSLEPLALRNGAFYHPQGAYQVFETPEGARIGIWAADPDDLVTEDIRLTKEQAQGHFKYNDKGHKVPLEEGDVLHARLKDLGNGNLDRLRIFTIKPHYMPQHWLREEMGKHQSAYRAFTLDQGTLIREAPTRWTSGGIVYQLVPAKVKKASVTSLQNYDVIMTQAPGFGWRLGREFNRLYRERSLSRVFMHAASVRAKNLTMKQAEDLITRDFERRAPLFVDGKSPYHTPLTFAHARKSFLMRNRATRAIVRWKPYRRARRLMREYHARNILLHAVYGAQQVSPMEVAKTMGVMAVSLVGLGTVMRVLGFEVNPLLLLGRLTTKTMTKTGERISEYNRLREVELKEKDVEELYDAYSKGFNKRQLWGARFSPERAFELEGIDHNRLSVDNNFYSEPRDQLPADMMVKNYILSVLQGPPGSVATPFRVGKFGAIRIDEPNGLSVEYVVERDAAFARIDPSKVGRSALPDAVIAEFNKNPKCPYLKVGYNPNRGGLFMEHMTEQKYQENMLQISLSSYPPEHRKPRNDKVRLVPEPVEKKRSWVRNMLSNVFGENASEALTETTVQMVEELGDEVVRTAREVPKHLIH